MIGKHIKEYWMFSAYFLFKKYYRKEKLLCWCGATVFVPTMSGHKHKVSLWLF